MSKQEQQELKEKYYGNAMRYMDNAKEYLNHAKKEGRFYQDPKYVKTACGTAYNGVLIALDGYLMLKGVEKPKGKARKSIEYYQNNIAKIDGKMLNYLNVTYRVLHLYGYYDGENSTDIIKTGFDEAYKIIEKIKPNGTINN